MAILSFPAGRSVMTPKDPETVALFGLPISNVTMAEAVSRIESAIQGGEKVQIATANLDFARNALRDAGLQRVICDCSMVLPDGAPMLWASRLLGKPLKERVTGVDLVPELARLSAAKGYRLFLLGSSDRCSEAAARVLEARFPGVQIVGRYSPPVSPLETMDNDAIFQRVIEADPDILLVAFGNPKQELWIHRFKWSMHVPVLIGIGGSLEMISGTLRRAPLVWQKMQLEWLYRMVQEPARLLPRYLRDAAALIRHLPLGFAVHQMQPVEDGAGQLEVISGEATREVTLPSRLSGNICHWLTREAENAISRKQSLLINMRDVHRVDPDGLGCLMELRHLLHAQGLTLWLAELSPTVRRVMEYSAVQGLFLIAETTKEAARMATLGVSPTGRPDRRRRSRESRVRQGSSARRANVA